MVSKFSTTKLTPESKKRLKKIALKTGEKMYRVIDRLTAQEIEKINSGVTI